MTIHESTLASHLQKHPQIITPVTSLPSCTCNNLLQQHHDSPTFHLTFPMHKGLAESSKYHGGYYYRPAQTHRLGFPISCPISSLTICLFLSDLYMHATGLENTVPLPKLTRNWASSSEVTGRVGGQANGQMEQLHKQPSLKLK